LQAKKVDMKVLGDIQKEYSVQIGRSLGGDWFEHALVDAQFWRQVLDAALKLTLE
jgi:hypothetical protein